MLELTRTLCGLSGVSSREEDVRSYLANALRPHVTHMETDAMGNLIAFKAGRKRTAASCCWTPTWTRWGSWFPATLPTAACAFPLWAAWTGGWSSGNGFISEKNAFWVFLA